MKRIVRLGLPPLLILSGLAFAASASAATISPTFSDFGNVGPGASSAPQTFTTTGQSGDDFTGQTLLLGSDPDEFQVTADGCTHHHIVNGTTCTVTVAFVPTYEIEGDLSASLFTQPYTGLASQYRAELLGHTIDQGEGGGKRGGGVSPQAKKKCKKIKSKAKRKKCLKKLGGGGRGGR